MLGKTLLTPVDNIVGYVKEKPNCTISYLRDKLNVPFTGFREVAL